MEILTNPALQTWPELCARASQDDGVVRDRVGAIIDRVKADGDKALKALWKEIDGIDIDCLQVSASEMEEAAATVSQKVKNAISAAAANIRLFHSRQMPKPVEVETAPGVKCLQKAVPIQKVGLYIPGGTAPLFSTVLMLAIPANVAGCPEVVLCTPVSAKTGKVAPEVLYAAGFCGISRIFKVGGAQAVAAMAFGTESIPRVDKIFGPGNRYVTTAKQLLGGREVSIDMPAGPSEVMVMADDSALAPFVAADLLSQAEHGADSQVMLVCSSEQIAAEVIGEVERQRAELPREAMVSGALSRSRVVVFDSREKMTDFANAYGAEHLIISMNRPWEIADRITAAGSVFIGNWSPESAGDYASGTNHTLPTCGWSRSCSGVNIDSFMRKITYQELTFDGLSSLAGTITAMADAEGLAAHANAVKVRMSAGPAKAEGDKTAAKRSIEGLIRPNIAALCPYSTARDEYSGPLGVFLDANESPYENGVNRYPDPHQKLLKERVSQVKGVAVENIFLGNGSDEAIDVLMRVFCEPGRDNILAMAPSYGMYEVAAETNDLEVRKVMLREDFTLDSEALLAAADSRTKLLFLCSPNNPSGNSIPVEQILDITDRFGGIVVLDEAYADFSTLPSLRTKVTEVPNLVVLQTLSKAWGMAGLRVGIAYASSRIITLMSMVKYPYNINVLAQRKAMEQLAKPIDAQVAEIVSQRAKVVGILEACPFVKKIYPSDANFVLVRVDDADALYNHLISDGIIVRNRTRVKGCKDCLRITVGTPAENEKLQKSLSEYEI